MGEVLFVQPNTIRIAKTMTTDEGVWDSLRDAVSEVADEADVSHIDLPVSLSARWIWWFASPAAGSWSWSSEAIAALSRGTNTSDQLDEVFAMSRAEQSNWDKSTPTPLELGIIRTLTDAQLRDVARMVRLGGGANFSVPGAGKTTMALTVWAILRRLFGVKRCVVVAPLSAHEAWKNEPLNIFDAGHQPDVRIRPRYFGGDVVVVNYEWLEAPERLDSLRQWATTASTLVIFDEAHRAKAGRSGRRGAAAQTLSMAVPFRMVLTGTPQPNTAADLSNVLELAYPGRGKSILASPSKLSASYCRITKSELNLPKLVARTERVPMSKAHDRIYEAMVDAAARAVIADASLLDDFARAGRIVMLLLQAATDPSAVLPVSGDLQMAGDKSDLELEALVRNLPSSFIPTKFVRAKQLIDRNIDLGVKTVMWTCFRNHVDRLAQLLAPYNPAVVTGATPVSMPTAPTDRERELARFRSDPNCGVLVATPHTLSEGVSLHHTTTHQIHLDRTFNAGMFLQSLDRTHRLGLASDAECTATYLIAQRYDGSETIDGLVARRLETKITAMSTALDDPGLVRLALPDLDDQLTSVDVLMGNGAAGDLAELFAHLAASRSV